MAMRAAVLHGVDDLRIEDRPVPEPASDELLLRVSTVGVCGSDLAELDHGPVLTPLRERHHTTGHRGPIVLGHEFSGAVETSRSSGFEPGELVACAAAVSCGICRYCKSGRTSICSSYWAVGLHRDGGLAEFCAVPAEACVRAEGLTPDLAALAQPMAIAVHAVKRSRLIRGEQMVLIGIGGIGAFITHVAAAMGAEVLACDLDPGRLTMAEHLGAQHTLDVESESDLPTVLAGLGMTPDVVMEATGTSPGLAAAQGAMGPGTRLVAVGIQHEPAEFTLRTLTLQEHEIIGTNALDLASDLPRAVKLLADSPNLWTAVAPTVISLEGLVETGLRGTSTPRPVKTLVSPTAEGPRNSQML